MVGSSGLSSFAPGSVWFSVLLCFLGVNQCCWCCWTHLVVKCSRINYTARCSQLDLTDQCQPRSVHNLSLSLSFLTISLSLPLCFPFFHTHTHTFIVDLIIKSIWASRALLMKQWSQMKFIWDHWEKEAMRVCTRVCQEVFVLFSFVIWLKQPNSCISMTPLIAQNLNTAMILGTLLIPKRLEGSWAVYFFRFIVVDVFFSQKNNGTTILVSKQT